MSLFSTIRNIALNSGFVTPATPSPPSIPVVREEFHSRHGGYSGGGHYGGHHHSGMYGGRHGISIGAGGYVVPSGWYGQGYWGGWGGCGGLYGGCGGGYWGWPVVGGLTSNGPYGVCSCRDGTTINQCGTNMVPSCAGSGGCQCVNALNYQDRGCGSTSNGVCQ